MSRYRVWEANRKVFLYPENWLEPELRDDQSPFFRETMSELLQGDITEDRAATALVNYLSKLEEVAKLEPCGIHYVENDPGTADDVAHVVARTAGANRKYFYRRREGGSWMPWEEIKLDIEDNPVIPVVWKGRLFLFWLRILQQTPLEPPQLPENGPDRLCDVNPSTVIKTDVPEVTVQAILCWSEYYNGNWQPAKTSDEKRPATVGRFAPGEFDRTALHLMIEKELGTLRVNVGFSPDPLIVSDYLVIRSSFVLYNTHSLPTHKEDPRLGHTLWEAYSSRRLTMSSGILRAFYTDFKDLWIQRLMLSVKGTEEAARLIVPRHDLERLSQWNMPFFFEDVRHVFYVSTSYQSKYFSDWSGYTVVVSQDNDKYIRSSEYEDDLRSETTQDTHRTIRRMIATTRPVRFGNNEIGPAGGLMNGMHK
jgi:hypothetical protein